MGKHISKIIVYKNQKRKRGCRVRLGFTGLLGGMSQPVNTDADGVARVGHSSTGNAEIFVDGKKVGEGKFPDRVILYL
ncbi:MAG: hypothetical protein J7642_03205 [Cyanobacteria bacterium SBC]|nr:hypothetical protein [Cyanobacteria bacterium SBC]